MTSKLPQNSFSFNNVSRNFENQEAIIRKFAKGLAFLSERRQSVLHETPILNVYMHIAFYKLYGTHPIIFVLKQRKKKKKVIEISNKKMVISDLLYHSL